MAVPIADDSMPVDVQLLIAVARIETKLDNGLARIDDHERRLRDARDDVESIKRQLASPLRVYAAPVSAATAFVMAALNIYLLAH